jgi:hypothetical protein
MNSNEPLKVATLTALPGAGPALVRPTSSLNQCLILQKVEQRRRVILLQYMYRITLQNVLLSNNSNISFRHTQYCSYLSSNFHCNFQRLSKI